MSVKPFVIAHRGLRNLYPENTRAAIEAALKVKGLYGIEFDVELAADAGVVLHQETMVLGTDKRKVIPAVRNFVSRDWVRELDSAQVGKLDAGSWFGAQFTAERVSMLDEILSLEWDQKRAFVELKDPSFWGQRDLKRPEEMFKVVGESLRLFSKRAQLAVVSFNPEMLCLARKIGNVELTLALWTEWRGRADEAIEMAKREGFAHLFLPDVLVLEAPEWVSAAHAAGLKISPYPVSPARGEPEYVQWTAESQRGKWLKLHEFGVDGIISDFPIETLEAIG
jgi:glycerophosphoryl diester phosphodiesterase